MTIENIRLERINEPGHEFINALGNGLSAHAEQSLGRPGFHGAGIRASNSSGELIGGIQAWINWNWMQIYLVWIAENQRGRGLGSRMLIEIEAIGIERGCEYAHLDTFSFQAPTFYQRHGYEEFGVLEDYPPGQRRHYLRKKLV